VKIKTHTFLFNNFSSEKRVFYEVKWKNMVEPGRPETAIKCGIENVHFLCRITKAEIQEHTLIIFNAYCFLID
jgi:hypothetical protein